MNYKLSITPEELEQLPMAAFTGHIHVIDKPGFAFQRAINYLKKQQVLGFDTETRPVFSAHQPRHGVALVQLSGPDHAYLFRIQTLGMRKQLCAILSDPNIVKIGAACHDDVRGLQRIAPFAEKTYIDLQKEVWKWGIKDKAVKKMAGIILGVRISKTQQLSNWEADTLSEAQQKYAATDAWVCREMWLKLQDSPQNPLEFDEQGNIKER